MQINPNYLTQNSAEVNLPPTKVENKALAFWKAKEAAKPLNNHIITVVKKEYVNKESLLLEPISSFRKDEIVEIKGYAFVVDEYLKYQESKEGAFMNPYTGEALTEDEKGKILQHPKGKAWALEMANREKRRPKDITEKTLMQLYTLGTVLASYGKNMDGNEIGDKDFAENEEASAVDAFDNYYRRLPIKERLALDKTKIGFFDFETSYAELQTNALCRQVFAMRLWQLLAKIGPHLLPKEVVEAAKRGNEPFLHDYVPKKNGDSIELGQIKH